MAKNSEKQFLGDMPALQSRRTNKSLERRQISFRWLSGAILTGVASVFLMGGALVAALDGRQQLSIPPQAFNKNNISEADSNVASKGARPGLLLNTALPADSDILNVSTVSREGALDVVKIKPFLHIITPLAVVPRAPVSYPKFDPLTIFSENGEPLAIASSNAGIYGADVDGEITFTTESFPYNSPQLSLARRQNENDIEEYVRNASVGLNTGGATLSSVSYFNNTRFAIEDPQSINPSGVTITAENVTELNRIDPATHTGTYFEERLARVRSNAPIHMILEGEGLGTTESNIVANAITSNLAASSFQIDDRLRIFIERNNITGLSALARISVYRAGTHMVSIAKNETGDFVYAQAPAPIPELSVASKKQRPLLSRSKLPSIYDAIYRASLNEGLTPKLAKQMIKIVSFDVDFKGSITRNDSISIFVSLEEGQEKPTETSEILYAAIKLGKKERLYYRFVDPESKMIDFYDETGKSAKQFLLREPVPNGRFNSKYGMRRHPVTRVRRMHHGVDWAAPRGTPILASGNGIIEKAGWHSGYGRQTIIRHANGYKTSYNHQHKFAKGVKEGSRVRQGQVIGYVGSTGLSTGPHLHYEVLVNGNRVDPMRIKLPRSKSIRGQDLIRFEEERDRIDALLKEREEENKLLALN